MGGHDDEAGELHLACFMGLVSFLASRPEVLRIAPIRRVKMLDAAARAIIQTATSTETPLTAAGLDGTGEVIQVRVYMGKSFLHDFPFSIDGQDTQACALFVNCCSSLVEP